MNTRKGKFELYEEQDIEDGIEEQNYLNIIFFLGAIKFLILIISLLINISNQTKSWRFSV